MKLLTNTKHRTASLLQQSDLFVLSVSMYKCFITLCCFVNGLDTANETKANQLFIGCVDFLHKHLQYLVIKTFHIAFQKFANSNSMSYFTPICFGCI